MKGVVIISLPPPDDPSQGKTITAAFTIPSSPSSPLPLHHALPIPSHAEPRHARRSRSLLSSTEKTIATILAFFLTITTLYVFLFADDAPVQLLEGSSNGSKNKTREANSFYFPLYSKSARVLPVGVGEVELLGGAMRSGQKYVVKVGASRNSSAVLPLGGSLFPDGQYYTSISIGNPLRPYFLDVDTGSDLTWIQCDAPCTSCAKGPHPLYRPAKEKIVPPRDSLCVEVQSNQNNKYCATCQQCDYEIDYADHSSSMGILARDEMQLSLVNRDRVNPNFVFGCAYDQQGHLLASPAKTDGILGLSSAKVSLPSQLASQGIINNVVGHCITGEVDDSGYMFLGDEFVPRWGMTWVPIYSNNMNFYGTEYRKLSYGDQQISMDGNGGQMLFDTGSSYTYFTGELYENLITSLNLISHGFVQDDSDKTLPVCWRPDSPVRSVEDVKKFFKPLTLQFRKWWWILPTELTILPEGYLMISNKGNICLGILDGSEVYDGSTLILGDISLRGKLVVYDNELQKIGWKDSGCAKPQKRSKDLFYFF